MRTRWVVLLVLASNLLTAVVVLGVGWYQERGAFDAAKWHARLPGDCNDDHRRRMTNDLGKSYLEVGMSRADVVWLLGEPDTSDEAAGGERTLLAWDTGSDGSDCSYFYVNFGPGGRTVVEWSESAD